MCLKSLWKFTHTLPVPLQKSPCAAVGSPANKYMTRSVQLSGSMSSLVALHATINLLISWTIPHPHPAKGSEFKLPEAVIRGKKLNLNWNLHIQIKSATPNWRGFIRWWCREEGGGRGKDRVRMCVLQVDLKPTFTQYLKQSVVWCLFQHAALLSIKTLCSSSCLCAYHIVLDGYIGNTSC